MKTRGEGERGFALLLVFVLAAAIAISFYMALPRETFEAQRRKEQLLVDRGQQYVTAIRRYYRQFRRFPAKIDDLENTNNVRFLRKRYVDPMTGKDDWRLIHAGPGGMLLDSLVQKPGTMTGATGQNSNQTAGATGDAFPSSSSSSSSFNSDGSGDSSGSNIAVSRNPGLVKRPSDHIPGAPSRGAATGPSADQWGDLNGDPNASANNGSDDTQGFPPAGFGDQPAPGTPGYPAQSTAGTSAGLGQNPLGNTQTTTGATAFPAGGANLQSGSFQQPGGAASPLNPALQQIRAQLTSPSANSPFGSNTSPFGGGQATGAGIVGVASKLAQTGIKEFDKHRKYSEWEFIFDLKKLNGLPGQSPQLQNLPGANSNSQNTSNSPFSQSSQQPSTTTPSTTMPQMPPTTVSPSND